MGLIDLIERAYQACVRPWPAAIGSIKELETTDPTVTSYEVEIAQEALSEAKRTIAFARDGRFQSARVTASSAAENGTLLGENDGCWDIWTGSDAELSWVPLLEACDLAARIDALLFSLEKHARSLALACRDDLDSLPVLADWCDDNGLPASAAELRHLHGLVRCLG